MCQFAYSSRDFLSVGEQPELDQCNAQNDEEERVRDRAAVSHFEEAEAHSQRAAAFAAVGKTGDAIREYQEAYRTFPNPATAEKIRELQRNSLGL